MKKNMKHTVASIIIGRATPSCEGRVLEPLLNQWSRTRLILTHPKMPRDGFYEA